MTINVSADDVHDALGDDDQSETVDFEITVAETIVNDELVPASGNDVNEERLKLVGALIAAAYVSENGGGDVESVSQGNASISFDTENALDHWRRAKQLDPTGHLGQLDKPQASLGVPSIHKRR